MFFFPAGLREKYSKLETIIGVTCLISTFQNHARSEVLNSSLENEWMWGWGQLQTQSGPLSQAPCPFVPLPWVGRFLENHWASEKWDCISSLSKCPGWLLSQEYFPLIKYYTNGSFSQVSNFGGNTHHNITCRRFRISHNKVWRKRLITNFQTEKERIYVYV